MSVFLSMFLSGLFALGSGQVAYLNVLAVPVPAAMGAPALATAGICDITLSFFDGQSNQLESNEVWINPGSSSSLALPAKDSKMPGKGQAMAYGEVQLMADSDPSCEIVPSLDLTDPNGRTTVLIPLIGRASPLMAK